ncbi:hypothetical protein [Pleomorphovibrio marinus]|uniref:hypothetical protein n=1 Tax=Pleomorphovibrio marinus TaxID=2164132 RepID=UPI000E0AA5B4|nr:hypothetical protein [Pleomorphovibrio marinus]
MNGGEEETTAVLQDLGCENHEGQYFPNPHWYCLNQGFRFNHPKPLPIFKGGVCYLLEVGGKLNGQ